MDSFDLRNWPGFAAAGGELQSPMIIEEIVADSRRISGRGALFVALTGSRQDGHQYIEQAYQRGAGAAIVKKGYRAPKGIKMRFLFVNDPLKTLQEIAEAYRKSLPCKIVGIIGSYGKTMVKDFLAAILEKSTEIAASPESFNSQIGVPLSVLRLRNHHKLALIEAGFSLPGEIERLAGIIRPDFTILTHIGPKHITTLGSLRKIAGEFAKFIKNTSPNGWILLPETKLLKLREKNNYYWNKSDQGLPHAKVVARHKSFAAAYRIDFPGNGFFEGNIRIGHYYWTDLLNITIKAATLLGVDKKRIYQIIKNYTPDPGRTEIARTLNGTLFINDTYSEDPQSVDCALDRLESFAAKGRKFFLFTGLKRGNEERTMERIALSIRKKGINELVYVNRLPWRSLEKAGGTFFPSLEKGLAYLKKRAVPGDALLIKGRRKESFEYIADLLDDGAGTSKCFINLAAVEENLKVIIGRLPKGTRIMPMIKARAYGTDELIMARFLQTNGIDIFGVSSADEAIALRKGAIETPIFVLNAAIYEIKKLVAYDLEIGVSDAEFIKELEQEALKAGKRIKVHLHVDTGMKRLGCPPDRALLLANMIKESRALLLEGLMTHFAAADNPEQNSFTSKQVELFQNVLKRLKKAGLRPSHIHAANSHYALYFNNSLFNMARIGIALFGFSSVEDNRLRPAVSLMSRIVGINECTKGDSVSYGCQYRVPADNCRIAVIPLGYFDGLHRHFSGKAFVIIHGRKAPQVGNICMDYHMVDISNIPEAKIGDPVLIFGRDEYGNYLPLSEMAAKVGSIPYELMTCLGPRIKRVFYYEDNYD